MPRSSQVDIARWSQKFAKDAPVKSWEDELGGYGIDADVPVAVVGDDLRETARAWWILRYWGVKDVRLLNGGWQAWLAGNYPTETKGTDSKPFISPKTPKLEPAEKRGKYSAYFVAMSA